MVNEVLLIVSTGPRWKAITRCFGPARVTSPCRARASRRRCPALRSLGSGCAVGLAVGEPVGEPEGDAVGVVLGSAYARPAPIPPARAALLTAAMMILDALFMEPVSSRRGRSRAMPADPSATF